MTMAGISEQTPAIGIDLGTAYSCAAVWWPDEVQMIPNNLGNNVTPSYVAFDGNQCQIGDSAVDFAALKPTNTVFDSKRLIGRRFSDPLVQSDKKRWPFKVIRGVNDKPMIVVTYKGEEKQFAAEQISSILLTNMKRSAEGFLGFSIKNAVITVPAYFNDAQRQATKNAGIIAGLNVLRITAEPTAAAIAYGLRKTSSSDVKNVLIFDLGGGTFDVSLVTVVKDTFAVKSIAGDTHLGGVDFDNRMVDHFVEEFKRKHEKDIKENPRALRRLRTACEKAKRVLSIMQCTTIMIDSLDDRIDFEYQLTREKFEELNMDLFKKCIDHVEKCLKDAEVDKRSIHDVVLVGGSTRIPKVQQLLQEFFDGKKLSKSIHPDEAVARGAAIQAASLNRQHNQEIREVVWMDVTPLSLGVPMSEDHMCVVVPRNTTFPTRKEIFITTTEDDQTQVVFPVYQGERPRASGNILLGEFALSGISPAPRGASRIEVCFEVDGNGILTVSAKDGTIGETSSITISIVKGILSKDETERMLEEAKKFELEDEEQQKKSLAESELEICVYGIRSIGLIKKRARKSQLACGRKTKDEIGFAIKWLDEHQAAEADVFENKRKRSWCRQIYGKGKIVPHTFTC